MSTIKEPGERGSVTAAYAAAEAPAGQAATLADEAPEAANSFDQPAMPKIPVRQLLPIFIASFTLFVAYIAPMSYSLAVRIAQLDPAGKDSVLPLAIGIPAILVVLINPLVGILSDRTRSRLGRRRPWMLAGGGPGVNASCR